MNIKSTHGLNSLNLFCIKESLLFVGTKTATAAMMEDCTASVGSQYCPGITQLFFMWSCLAKPLELTFFIISFLGIWESFLLILPLALYLFFQCFIYSSVFLISSPPFCVGSTEKKMYFFYPLFLSNCIHKHTLKYYFYADVIHKSSPYSKPLSERGARTGENFLS